jgi:hypothetical protein
LGPILEGTLYFISGRSKLIEWLEGAVNLIEIGVFRLGLIEKGFTIVKLFNFVKGGIQGFSELKSIGGKVIGIFKVVELLDLLKSLLEALD